MGTQAKGRPGPASCRRLCTPSIIKGTIGAPTESPQAKKIFVKFFALLDVRHKPGSGFRKKDARSEDFEFGKSPFQRDEPGLF